MGSVWLLFFLFLVLLAGSTAIATIALLASIVSYERELLPSKQFLSMVTRLLVGSFFWLSVSEMFVRFCAAVHFIGLLMTDMKFRFEVLLLARFPNFPVAAFASVYYLWDGGRCREFRAWAWILWVVGSLEGGVGGWRRRYRCRCGCLARFLMLMGVGVGRTLVGLFW